MRDGRAVIARGAIQNDATPSYADVEEETVLLRTSQTPLVHWGELFVASAEQMPPPASILRMLQPLKQHLNALSEQRGLTSREHAGMNALCELEKDCHTLQHVSNDEWTSSGGTVKEKERRYLVRRRLFQRMEAFRRAMDLGTSLSPPT